MRRHGLWRVSSPSSKYSSSRAMDRHALPLSYSTERRRHSQIQACRRLLTFRRIRNAFALILVLFTLKVLSSGIPSTYKDVRIYERQLPQHNISQALARGTKYLRIPNRVWGHGLNNVLQEAIVLAHLAYKVERSYVFEDYVWSKVPLPFTIYDFALRPTRVPLNAILSGPIAGDSINDPKAVSAEFWESVCPPESRQIISSDEQPWDTEGDVLMNWWIHRLDSVNDTCVEINAVPKTMFDLYLFGSTRVLSFWEELVKSPVVTDFAWSPLVRSVLSRNAPIIEPSNSAEALEAITSRGQIHGLVAIHVRRGDFSRHCPRLEKYSSSYMGFNQFPEFRDRFDPWKYKNYDERMEYYMRHCYPTVAQVAEKLWAVRTENPGLRRVYVMTNGWGGWMRELRRILKSDGWEDVKSTFDMELDLAQNHVSMAVDMAIAEKAEVFIGNGFSSLTSNIMTLRMAKGLDPLTNRLL